MRDTPYAAVIEPFLSPLEVPCTQPPWGFLSAIDLTTSKTLWQRVLGTGRDSGPFGIPSLLPLEIGVPNLGGVVSTGGGLAFISGTLDRYVRAFDLRTGEELWKVRLPAGGQATPMTYSAGGRQYLLVTAGGHGFMNTPRGDYTIAYALPDSQNPEEKTND
jgi:quinoprotein glucose dehydrogenase